MRRSGFPRPSSTVQLEPAQGNHFQHRTSQRSPNLRNLSATPFIPFINLNTNLSSPSPPSVVANPHCPLHGQSNLPSLCPQSSSPSPPHCLCVCARVSGCPASFFAVCSRRSSHSWPLSSAFHSAFNHRRIGPISITDARFRRSCSSTPLPQLRLSPTPVAMPSAVPVEGASTPNGSTEALSANDNIRRFVAPSRPLSPPASHTLFHPKTRCFV